MRARGWKRWTAQPWSRRRWFVLGGGVLVAALTLWLLPLAATTSPEGLSPSERAEDVGRTRTAILALGAGVLAVIGAFLTHDNVEVAREQNDLTLRSQRAERYASGAQQLAHDEEHVRLAAVYALGALAQESSADRPAALSVLAAHAVKWGRLPEGWALEPDNARGALTTETVSREVAGVLETIVARPADEASTWSGSLRDSWLCRLGLASGSLAGLDLTGSDMRNASLVNVDLGNANLNNVMLTKSVLGTVTGTGTWLSGTNFVDALLVKVQLDTARLDGAFFMGASGSLDLAEVSAMKTVFDTANLNDMTWNGVEARSASFVRTSISGSAFRAVDFAHSTWIETEVTAVEFRGCNFGFLDLRAVKFTRVRFIECDLSDTMIDTDGSTFTDVEMRDCELGTGVQFLDRAGIRIT